jgi:hypothetical protein
MATVDAVSAEAYVLLSALGDAFTGVEQTSATNREKGAVDASVAVLFALALFVFNWGTRKGLLEPLARRALPSGHSTAQVDKFGQSASEALFYGCSFVVGCIVVPRQPWIWPSELWWKGKTVPPSVDSEHALLCDDLKCYILLYFGRYLQGVISCCMEHKRKDFVEMQVHHCTTLALIFLSYTHQYNRIGVVVMILLDPADVPLHLAKLCKYSLRDGLADVFFYTFGISFFVTRLVFYPYVVWSAHFEAARHFDYGVPEWACVGLLYVLLVLQVYWFALIAKVAIRLIINGEDVADVRSDSDEDEPPAKKKE